MLHGSRLGVLIFMMKGRHSVYLPFSQSPDIQNVPSAAHVAWIMQLLGRRYNEMEARSAELITRLQALGEPARHYPGYRGARKLLNDIYHKQRVAKRLAVLDAASWLVAVLEELPPLV